jgi:hypothetical protein
MPCSALAAAFVAALAGAHDPGNTQVSADPTGAIETFNVNGRANAHGAFFQSLGTNGRSCATCHVADQAMSISPPQRFAMSLTEEQKRQLVAFLNSLQKGLRRLG